MTGSAIGLQPEGGAALFRHEVHVLGMALEVRAHEWTEREYPIASTPRLDESSRNERAPETRAFMPSVDLGVHERDRAVYSPVLSEAYERAVYLDLETVAFGHVVDSGHAGRQRGRHRPRRRRASSAPIGSS